MHMNPMTSTLSIRNPRIDKWINNHENYKRSLIVLYSFNKSFIHFVLHYEFLDF